MPFPLIGYNPGMTSKTPSTLLQFVLLLSIPLWLPVFAQDFSKVEIKATKVAGSVYMLEGSGGNIGVSVGEDGIIIVDDQFAPLAAKIREALKNISDKPIRFVLNTHFHGDHAGGNVEFGKEASGHYLYRASNRSPERRRYSRDSFSSWSHRWR